MQARDRGWLPAFLLLSAIWGSSFLFIKVGVEDFAPFQVAFARCALGALALVAILAARRERLPRGRRVWLHLFAIAVLFNSVPFALFAFGETEVSSVVAGISNSTTPLWVMLVSLAVLPEEPPTPARVAGLFVGFAGVLVVLGPWRDVGGELDGYLACFAAAGCYGLAYPYTRRVLAGRPESGVSLSAAQVLLGTLQLAPFAAITTSAPEAYPLDAVLALVALGAGGTGIAYVINYDLIRRAGAQLASTVTYVVPLFATVLGVLVLDEHLSWNQPMGAAVVLLGVALTQGRLSRPRRG
ncbi:MAG TPA: DMT family transporter [Thermoleophilaceae bacterium]|nr:DMT family transporter [Thermoleophilaceae bacterium]